MEAHIIYSVSACQLTVISLQLFPLSDIYSFSLRFLGRSQ